MRSGVAPGFSITRGVLAMRVFTTTEVAKALGLSIRTITKCVDSGSLPGFRIPGSSHRRIPEESLWAFMAKNNLPIDGLNELLRTKGKECS